jgi:hypothetical protein
VLAYGILRVIDELWRMEKLLRVSAWSEVDVRWLTSRELMEEDDGGGSAHVGHRRRQFELEAVAVCIGRRGVAFPTFDGDGSVWTMVVMENWPAVWESSAEMNGGARRRNGSGLLLLGFHAQDKVEGEAVH